MKLNHPFAAIGMIGMALCLAGSTQAQETNVAKPQESNTAESLSNTDGGSAAGAVTVADTADREGRILSADQVDLEVALKGESGDPVTTDSLSLLDRLRLNRADYPALSVEVVERLKVFRRQRERYLREQEKLLKRFKGATDAERERIREMLRDRRLRWMEQSRNMYDEHRDRLREMLREMPQYREPLEAAREAVKAQIDDELQEVRRPRKID